MRAFEVLGSRIKQANERSVKHFEFCTGSASTLCHTTLSFFPVPKMLYLLIISQFFPSLPGKQESLESN